MTQSLLSPLAKKKMFSIVVSSLPYPSTTYCQALEKKKISANREKRDVVILHKGTHCISEGRHNFYTEFSQLLSRDFQKAVMKHQLPKNCKCRIKNVKLRNLMTTKILFVIKHVWKKKQLGLCEHGLLSQFYHKQVKIRFFPCKILYYQTVGLCGCPQIK